MKNQTMWLVFVLVVVVVGGYAVMRYRKHAVVAPAPVAIELAVVPTEAAPAAMPEMPATAQK